MAFNLSCASLIIADNRNALGLILLPAGRSISVLFDLLCKIRAPLSLSLNEELADLSLPLPFFPSP